MTPAFLDELLAFWRADGFDPAGKSFLIALSGGADSVALLELFVREVAPRWNTPLFAVHVNHGLRAEAAADQRFVEALCRDRGVPLHVETLEPATRRAGQSVEMWGREERYAVFARASARFGATTVLTAHHRDDAVETFFLRAWRGTGFAGLAGIPFRRAMNPAPYPAEGRALPRASGVAFAGAAGSGVAGEIVRPLLPVPRASLREWLRALGTSWREDASNLDARIARNWLRHRYLPDLRAREPGLDARVFALARAAASALPAWERWNAAEHPVETVSELGGVPAGWLRAGMEAAALKACLVALGLENPAPELLTELLRQAEGSQASEGPEGPEGSKGAKGSAARIQARIDESSVLIEKRGILVRSRSEFRRKASA